MGGFGAGHLGFKYPEVFGTVCVDAGALITERAFSGPNLAEIFKDAFAGDKDRFLAEHPRWWAGWWTVQQRRRLGGMSGAVVDSKWT